MSFVRELQRCGRVVRVGISIILAILCCTCIKPHFAYAETAKVNVAGTISVQLDTYIDPDPEPDPDPDPDPDVPEPAPDPDNPDPSNPDAPIPEENGGSSAEDEGASALQASAINNSNEASWLAKTGDVLPIALICIFGATAILTLCAYKSRKRVLAGSSENSLVYANTSKSKYVLIIVLSLGLVATGITFATRAFGEDVSAVTASGKVIVDKDGNILSTTLELKNNYNTNVTVSSVSAPKDFPNWKANITENTTIDANATLTTTWIPDENTIPDDMVASLTLGEGRIWIPFENTVSYENRTVKWNSNGANETITDVKVVDGSIVSLPTDVLTKDKSAFDSWNTKADGTGKTVDATYLATHPITSDTEFFAKWGPAVYKIEYDLDGGEFAKDVVPDYTYTYGVGIWELKNPVREGYEFLGWFKSKDALDPSLMIPDDAFGDIKFTARWLKLCKVTYDATGGEKSSVSGKFKDGTDTYIEYVRLGEKIVGKKDKPEDYGEDPTPIDNKKNSFAFVGWYTEESGKGTIAHYQSYVVNEDTVLYAYYDEVSFLANATFDGKNPMASTGRWSLDELNKASKEIAQYGEDTIYYARLRQYMQNDSHHLFTLLRDKNGNYQTPLARQNWMEFRIVGLKPHDNDGTGITFSAVHLYWKSFRMNETETQEGGWTGSELHEKMQQGGEIYEAFDPRLSEDVVDIKSPSDKGKYWVPAFTEVFDKTQHYVKADGEQYEFWAHAGNSKYLEMRYASGGDEVPGMYEQEVWWLRTPSGNPSDWFYCVAGTESGAKNPSRNYGLVVCFAL